LFASVGAVLKYKKLGSNILFDVVQVIVIIISYSCGLMRLISVWFIDKNDIILILTVLLCCII